MMKFTQTMALAVGLAAAFGAARSAEAGQIILEADGVNYTGNVGGGEFRVTEFTGFGSVPAQGAAVPVGGIFETFCLELNETIQIGHEYDWTLSTAAVGGGNGGGSPDPLGNLSAFLYQKFWDGTLASQGYNYTQGSSRTASASALQLAFWLLENEFATNDGSAYANIYNDNTAGSVGALAQSFVSYANSNAPAGIGNVRVLNLTETVVVNGVSTVQNRQSVLVLVPLPPAAWLGLGLMSAIGVVGAISRRKRQALT